MEQALIVPLARVVFFLIVLAVAPARAAVLAAYTVLGSDGAVARAVVDDAACPAIEIDGSSATMQVRVAADTRFPLVCEAALPPAASTARIGAMALPLPKPEVRRIALFGDSGCRVDRNTFQSCNDPAVWPFARTSAAAAALAPDLVIHVGDYYYRERPCPAGNSGCAGTPSGDDWLAWQADFFIPARPLLAAAPWVVVRGNHENCDRGGTGFFRLLDPRPYPATCPDVSAIYRVMAGALPLYVLDSGEASDTITSGDLVERYRTQFAALRPSPGGWLLTHRPLWGVVRVGAAIGLSLLVNDNATLQEATRNALPDGLEMVVSGHVHLFEALGFADRRPPQLILGTAGSALDQEITTDLVGRAIGGTTIAYGRTLHAFGVTTMERSGQGWAATLRDEEGRPRFTCTVADRAVSCAP